MRKIKMLTVGVFAVGTIMIPSTMATAAPNKVWTGNVARDTIIMRESSGNPNAVNPSSGTTGLYQCMPSVHRCPALGDVAGQHQWGQNYMKSRYGTWQNALAFHNANHWW